MSSPLNPYESPASVASATPDELPVDWILAERGTNLSLAGTASLGVTLLVLYFDLSAMSPVVRGSIMLGALLLCAGGLLALVGSNLCLAMSLPDAGARVLAGLAAASVLSLPFDLIRQSLGLTGGVHANQWITGLMMGGFIVGLAAHPLVLRGLGVRLESGAAAHPGLLVFLLWLVVLAASMVTHFSSYVHSERLDHVVVERFSPLVRDTALMTQRVTWILGLLGTLAVGALVRAAMVARPADGATGIKPVVS
jgi:hypothetical protein